jgi:hypothetical protein
MSGVNPTPESSQRLQKSNQGGPFLRGHLDQQTDNLQQGSSGCLLCATRLALWWPLRVAAEHRHPESLSRPTGGACRDRAPSCLGWPPLGGRLSKIEAKQNHATR